MQACSDVQVHYDSQAQSHNMFKLFRISAASFDHRTIHTRWSALDGNVFRVTTVVLSPAVVSTLGDRRLSAVAIQIVEPNWPIASTKRIVSRPTTAENNSQTMTQICQRVAHICSQTCRRPLPMTVCKVLLEDVLLETPNITACQPNVTKTSENPESFIQSMLFTVTAKSIG